MLSTNLTMVRKSPLLHSAPPRLASAWVAPSATRACSAPPCAVQVKKTKGEPSTLYVKGRILGYKRCGALHMTLWLLAGAPPCARVTRRVRCAAAPTTDMLLRPAWHPQEQGQPVREHFSH